MMSIKQVAILGAGTMGSGIAQVFAQAGYRVILVDISQDQLARGMAAIERGTAHLVSRGRMTAEERTALLGRIVPTLSLQEVAAAELVLEAVTETLETKINLLTRVDALLPAQAILATNTSSLSITRLAAATARPERFIG
ncbi:MAG: 3-hydroxybutyryl-CoA dehydrogenase, partial [Chloroflexi bacterium]|nr:3-hydroxybutyryl-CoA dehydrogenase [Chloroflexota bacterium]